MTEVVKKHSAGFDMPVRPGSVFQREAAVNERTDLPRPDQLAHGVAAIPALAEDIATRRVERYLATVEPRPDHPGPAGDILKPDITAPGINILAGFTPDATNAMPGENFAYLSGTSMSTPHVAGVAALLLEARPDWTPAAIKSALMTSARQDITADDGETPANPFDFGAGHIVPNAARTPGLVYDVSNDEYDAFACGTASPAVSPAPSIASAKPLPPSASTMVFAPSGVT